MRLSRQTVPVHSFVNAGAKLQLRSMAINGSSTVADVLTHDEIGDVVEVGRLAIDDDKRAPLRFASSGNPAAGQTTSEEPIARKDRSRASSSSARRIALVRHRLPERDGRGLDVAAAVRAIRRAPSPASKRSLHPCNS